MIGASIGSAALCYEVVSQAWLDSFELQLTSCSARHCELSCNGCGQGFTYRHRLVTSHSEVTLAATSLPCKSTLREFSSKLTPIQRYPPTSIFIAIGRFGIVLLVGLAYPLQVLPCRACIHGLTLGLFGSSEDEQVAAPEDEEDEDHEEEEDDPLVPKPDEEEDESHGPGDMSNTKFYVVTTGIVIVSYLIAAEVDELEVGE